MKKYMMIVGFLIVGTAFSSSAAENRCQQFNMDVQAAYSAYRQALFQTNKKNADSSQKAVNSFQQAWKVIISTYGLLPPEVYSSDQKWEQTLKTIGMITEKSAEQIRDGELALAHETLEAVRDELSDLRRRNSVIVFSDHINNYHQVMEELLLAGYTSEIMNADVINHIREQHAVLRYLAANIKKNAPQEYRENQKYLQLQQGLVGSLDQLKQAISEAAPDKIPAAIQQLKPAYAKLFLNFG